MNSFIRSVCTLRFFPVAVSSSDEMPEVSIPAIRRCKSHDNTEQSTGQ